MNLDQLLRAGAQRNKYLAQKKLRAAQPKPVKPVSPPSSSALGRRTYSNSTPELQVFNKTNSLLTKKSETLTVDEQQFLNSNLLEETGETGEAATVTTATAATVGSPFTSFVKSEGKFDNLVGDEFYQFDPIRLSELEKELQSICNGSSYQNLVIQSHPWLKEIATEDQIRSSIADRIIETDHDETDVLGPFCRRPDLAFFPGR